VGGFRAILAGAAATLALAGCGGSDDDKQKDSGPLAGNDSPMKCLVFSTLSPEQYDASGSGVEKGVKPLLTGGAKGAEILTGKMSAVVIEYPTPEAASGAQKEARASKVLRDYIEPDRIKLLDRVVFLDYEGESEVGRVVEACARRPDQTPPTG
jgi:hypothetical protein